MPVRFALFAILVPILTADAPFSAAGGDAVATAAQFSDAPPGATAARLKTPVQLSPTFPRSGVDQVVTYDYRDGTLITGNRVTVYRHGALVRVDTQMQPRPNTPARATTTFANLDTGAALTQTRGVDGKLATLSIWRSGSPDLPAYRHVIAPSGATEVIAGEPCAIVVARPETSDGVKYSACITRDGIALRETAHYRDDTVMEEKRALKVERRPVALADVLPPRDALDWAGWTRPPSARGENYALTLVAHKQDKGATVWTKTFRAAGGWKSENEQNDAGDRNILLTGPTVTLSFYSQSGQLGISRMTGGSQPGPVARDGFRSAPLNRPTESLIGEICSWFNASVGVSDYDRSECRTTDSLPLIIAEHSGWGGATTRWEAVALDRGKVPPGELRPPPWLLRWSYWGWPQLDAGVSTPQ